MYDYGTAVICKTFNQESSYLYTYHLLSSTAKKIIFEHAKFSNVTCLTVNRMRIKIFNFQMLTRT